MWVKQKVAFWNNAPMFRLLLPLAIGIACYDKIGNQNLSGIQLLAALIIFFILFLLVSILSLKKGRFKYIQFIVAQILLLLLGFTYSFNTDQRNYTNYIGKQLHSSKAFLAVITAAPEEKEHSVKLSLQLLKSINNDTISAIEGNVFVYQYKSDTPSTLQQGDQVIVPNHLQTITNSGNPFEFDYATFCKRKNIFYQQFMTSEEVKLWQPCHKSQNSLVIKAHDYCIVQLNHYIQDSSSLALLKAMLVGDESGIDPGLRQAYSDTGIIHVISISGAHVGFFFMLIAFLLRWVRNKKYQWIQFVISLSFVWFYVLMAGSSAPAIRAALMFSIVATGNILNKQSNPLNQLFTAAFIMLLWQPMWLFSVGFQLSFIAILSLIIFYKPIATFRQPKHPIIKWLYNAAAASIAAEILVAPLVAYYFHSFPPLFIIANIIACITMGTVLALGMGIIIFSTIPIFAGVLATVTEWICMGFHKCIYSLQSFNIEPLKTIYLNSCSLLLLYIIITGCSIYLLRHKKQAIWLTLFGLLLFSITLFLNEWESAHQQVFIVYNNSKECRSELLSGNHYSVLSGDSTETYNTKAAHIGLHSINKLSSEKPDLIIIKNKKILLLNNNIHFDKNAAFPVDILVIQSAFKQISIPELQRVFSPKKIVIANNQNKKNSTIWKAACTDANIAFHDTKTDGAYILR